MRIGLFLCTKKVDEINSIILLVSSAIVDPCYCYNSYSLNQPMYTSDECRLCILYNTVIIEILSILVT